MKFYQKTLYGIEKIYVDDALETSKSILEQDGSNRSGANNFF
jgi:hypothetical protein